MKHEYTAILNHLRVKHNMTLTHYTQTYIRGELAVAGPGDHEPVEITPELNIADEEEAEEEEVEADMRDIAEEMDEAATSEVTDHQEEFYIVDPTNMN